MNRILDKILSKFFKPKKLKRGHVYVKDDHSSWGNSIRFENQPKTFRDIKSVNGHLNRIPRAGDVLEVDHEEGVVIEFQFTKVDQCSNPRDMFFADVELIGVFNRNNDDTYILEGLA